MPGLARLAAPRRPSSFMLAAALALLAAAPLQASERGDDPDAAARLVREGDAAARAGRADDARRSYLSAAGRVPDAADWLLLRAATLSVDSAERARLYARVGTEVARARITLTEAQAREKAGDYAGAAVRYDSAGRHADAFRLRLLGADDPTRAALQRALLAHVTSTPVNADRRAALALLVRELPPLGGADALRVARAAAAAGQLSIAADQYAAAFKRGSGASADRLAHGRVLARLGRHRDAIAAFRRVTTPAAAAAEARYLMGRSQLRLGDRREAIDTWWGVVERYPAAAASTAPAMYLIGDLAWTDGEAAEARRVWLDIVRRFPRHADAPRAAFNAALAAYTAGRKQAAAAEWDALARRWPRAEAAPAAQYWSGRAWAELGRRARAESRWQQVVTSDTLGYYAVLAARRLGTEPWSPAPAADRFAAYGEIDSAAARLAALATLEMSTEQSWEREWLSTRAGEDPERLLATAAVFRGEGQAAYGMRLARRALAAGAAPDARTYRLIFPATHLAVVSEAASREGLDPLMVTALIRQESLWEPRATSPAGARGLMQVMPATGRELARALGVDGFHPDRLWEPELNVRFGVRHLAAQVRRFDGDLVRTLASYNAGRTPVLRWSERTGAADAELFTEWIGYTETRHYVQVIQRNVALYRALYDWPS